MLFTVLVPGTVIIYFPYTLIAKSGGILNAVNLGLALPAGLCMLAGLTIYLRCAWDFAVEGLGTPAPIDPPKKLVVTGLYRRTRNPMYLGVILLLSAECFLFPEAGLLAYLLSVATVFHVFVVFYEEPALGARFGQAYLDYCDQVPRWGVASRPFVAR